MSNHTAPLRHSRLAVPLLMLAGCAGVPQQPAIDGALACRALFAQVDRAVAQQGVRDHGPTPIEGFPYLRTTRLLASFRDELDTPERFAAWSRHLAALDAQARLFEVRNLSSPVGGLSEEELLGRLAHCREQLLSSELGQPELQRQLRTAVQVPDDYVTWWRMAGLYPLSAPFISLGIRRWHAETQRTFATPLAELPVQGVLTRWSAPPGRPLARSEISRLLDKRDALGLPQLAPEQMQRLFDTFAPLWEVDVANAADRIGTPLGEKGGVDINQPRLYRLASYTRFDGQVLLQLNYIVWFAARPGNDIYAGLLDGLNWRVTLGPDGTPWLYDVIHNCGCYYQALPTPHLRLRSDSSTLYLEPPLVPQNAPVGMPLVLRIASTTHYLQRVYHDERSLETIPLVWSDYDSLRSLTVSSGRHSLFGEHGIVVASRRPERYLLWPMGVRSPGAMRQWHRHAIAFVGRRHFDDAHLLDTLFEPVSTPGYSASEE